jgi:hypothetical protein
MRTDPPTLICVFITLAVAAVSFWAALRVLS